jgi:hypothetical protein
MKRPLIVFAFVFAAVALVIEGKELTAQSVPGSPPMQRWQYATLEVNEIPSIGDATAWWRPSSDAKDCLFESAHGDPPSHQGEKAFENLSEKLAGKKDQGLAPILNWAGSNGWRFASVSFQRSGIEADADQSTIYVFERPIP